MKVQYVGMDVHKKTVSYCVKEADGSVIDKGVVRANRRSLGVWAEGLKTPWIGGMEATMFTSWIYDTVRPFAEEVKVGHPLMLRSIVNSKVKNDAMDASKLADLLRCDLFPECYMARRETRELRRVLRFRNLMVREAVRLKNKTAGLLMEAGVEYNKQRLHGSSYFAELLRNLEDVPEGLIDLLKISRASVEFFRTAQGRLIRSLKEHPALKERVELLRTIQGVGEVTALTWALEIDDPKRFRKVGKAVSYCGLCSAERESGGKR